MKGSLLTLYFLLFILICAEGQVKSILTYKIIGGAFYDQNNPLLHYRFFKNQSLVNYRESEEKSLASYYCISSKEGFEKFVLGGVYNAYFPEKIKVIDTSQSWVDIVSKISFIYQDKYELSFIRYKLCFNGVTPKKILFTRFLKENSKEGGYVYLIDKRNDDKFLDDLTYIFGNLKESTLRMLFGIDQPNTKDETELVNLVTSKESGLHINQLVEMFIQGDSRILKFLDQ